MVLPVILSRTASVALPPQNTFLREDVICSSAWPSVWQLELRSVEAIFNRVNHLFLTEYIWYKDYKSHQIKHAEELTSVSLMVTSIMFKISHYPDAFVQGVLQ